MKKQTADGGVVAMRLGTVRAGITRAMCCSFVCRYFHCFC